MFFLEVALKERIVVVKFRMKGFIAERFRLDVEIAFQPKAVSSDFDQIGPTSLLDIVYQSFIEHGIIFQTLFYLLNDIVRKSFLRVFLQNVSLA